MTETILGGILIAIVSGAVGKTLGERNTVKTSICIKNREACRDLIGEKLENLGEKVEDLTKAVNHKLYGL